MIGRRGFLTGEDAAAAGPGPEKREFGRWHPARAIGQFGALAACLNLLDKAIGTAYRLAPKSANYG